MAVVLARAPTWGVQGGYMEKRQLFLRSYHFSRKRTAMDRAKHSLGRVRRLIWVRLRSARSLPRLVWCRLKLRLRLRLRLSFPSSSRRHSGFQRLTRFAHPRRSGGNDDCWSYFV